MRNGRQATLLLFKAGGERFAVEAASVRRVATADWAPAGGDPGQGNAQSVCLAEELGLGPEPGGRTLVVDAQGGPWGFRVGSIESEVLGEYHVQAIPKLLTGWMEPVVVCGVADSASGDGLIHVLDLRLLAHHLQARGDRDRKGTSE